MLEGSVFALKIDVYSFPAPKIASPPSGQEEDIQFTTEPLIGVAFNNWKSADAECRGDLRPYSKRSRLNGKSSTSHYRKLKFFPAKEKEQTAS